MNESRLEKRLRFQLDCSEVRWRKPKKDGTFAQVEADSGKKIIWLPPGFDDHYTLRTMFHELCHVAIPGELAAFGDFQEDVIERVLEPRLMEYMVRHPRSHSWWLKKLRELREAS